MITTANELKARLDGMVQEKTWDPELPVVALMASCGYSVTRRGKANALPPDGTETAELEGLRDV